MEKLLSAAEREIHSVPRGARGPRRPRGKSSTWIWRTTTRSTATRSGRGGRGKGT